MKELAKQRKVSKLGTLWSFTKEEHEQLKTLKSLVDHYIELPKPSRPLCLAVFGPPGSGKSFVVREICRDLEDNSSTKLPFVEVNLTELASTSDLVRTIRDVQRHSGDRSVPVVFFDEFDAPLDGVPLGWLSRFLAPMQDGTLVDDGWRAEVKRAVYIFAGGTAARMADFGEPVTDRFRSAKGPDFVSRLRGYVDVHGPNDSHLRSLRRAQLIRSALEDVRKARGANEDATPGVSNELLGAMLEVGRYRHGSRSIKAIIEMAAAASAREKHPAGEPETLELRHLPPDHVLDVHRDLGQLDPLVIGGLIGLSAGDPEVPTVGKPAVPPWKSIATDVAHELWKIGAVIGYGGKWEKEYLTTELVKRLRREAGSLVEAASRLTNAKQPQQRVRVEVFTRQQPKANVPNKIGMTAIPVPTHWHPESKDPHLHKASTTFRMRWAMSCRCVARVLIAGKTKSFSGRMPGILEETILALSLNQPLYIIGGFLGGAHVVGELLGLARDWPNAGRQIGCFGERSADAADMDRAVSQAPSLFRPAGFPGLPLTFDDAMAFVTGYAIGGPRWPPNGLTLHENRELFAARASKEIIDLVVRGLTRRFPG